MQGAEHYTPWAKSDLLPAFVFFGKLSHPWTCCMVTTAEFHGYNRDCMIHEA